MTEDRHPDGWEMASTVTDSGGFRNDWTVDEVKNEPMLFNCSVGWAADHSGPITQTFIEGLPDRFRDGVIDSRVHMLMPGWYPCIPGWHHDDVARTVPDPFVGPQPDYDNPPYRAEHVLGIAGADVSLTEFAVGSAWFPRPPVGVTCYGWWHPMVEDRITSGVLQRFQVTAGRYWVFNDRAWHRGMPATGPGWRWFARVSIGTDRVRHVTNEHRQQVQVYLPDVNAGW